MTNNKKLLFGIGAILVLIVVMWQEINFFGPKEHVQIDLVEVRPHSAIIKWKTDDVASIFMLITSASKPGWEMSEHAGDEKEGQYLVLGLEPDQDYQVSAKSLPVSLKVMDANGVFMPKVLEDNIFYSRSYVLHTPKEE